MDWLLTIGGVLFCVGGILAYTGVWWTWAYTRLGYGAGFMLLCGGIASLAAQVTNVLLDAGMLWFGIGSFLIAVVAMITAVGSMVWLPRFLTPAWFDEVRGRGARRQRTVQPVPHERRRHPCAVGCHRFRK